MIGRVKLRALGTQGFAFEYRGTALNPQGRPWKHPKAMRNYFLMIPG